MDYPTILSPYPILPDIPQTSKKFLEDYVHFLNRQALFTLISIVIKDIKKIRSK
jgi:hypothetical protein